MSALDKEKCLFKGIPALLMEDFTSEVFCAFCIWTALLFSADLFFSGLFEQVLDLNRHLCTPDHYLFTRNHRNLFTLNRHYLFTPNRR